MMIEIRELTSEAEIEAAYPLMASLRDRITRETFLPEVQRQRRDGYELVGGFDEGRLVALAGIRRSHTLSRGEHLFVDDLVTDETSRGLGHGTDMLRWIAARARALGIPRVYLDSRLSAKGFYELVGFTFLTAVPCWIDADTL